MFINTWRRFLGGLKNRINALSARDGSRRRRPQLFLEPLEPRIVLSTNTWLNSLGGSWNDPSNWSTGAVPTAADNVVINLSSAATIRLSGGAAAVNSLQVNNSLVLDGAALTVAGDITNAGEIDLTSTAGSADASLTVDGLLTNSPTGLLLAEQGAGGNRYIIGDWINQGTVDAQSNLVLSGINGSGPDFTQAGGDITTEDGASVIQNGGAFHYTGGALDGPYIPNGVALDVQNTVTATATIDIQGQNNVLDENAAPGVTLQVDGTYNNGNGVLTAVDGAVNDGVIDLDTVGWYWWFNSSLAVAPGGTLTNEPTGVIRALPSSGGVTIDGNLVNQGLIDAAGQSLTLQGTSSGGPNFTQAGGDITSEGAGVSVVQGGGVFHYTGGAISGDYIVVGTELDIRSTVAATALIEVRGQGNVLDENAAPNVTLEVEGSDNNGDGVLTAADGAVNDGVIELDTIGWYWWFNSSLDVASGGTFTNAAGGAIVVNTDSGGGRYLNGNIVNQGEITANSNEQWSGNLTNAGTIDIVAGVEVDVNGTTSTLSQTGGELDVEGTLSVNGAALDITGGALIGGGTLLVQNSQLSFGGDAAGPLVVQAVGQGNVLLNNLAPGVTIWVRGDDRFNDGVLTVAPDAVNAGTILLESASSWWWSILSIQDTLDNSSTGVIQVSLGAGGGRSIQGNLSNEGTITIDADAGVEIDGNGDGAPTLTQNDGVIQANGQLLLNSGMLDFEGGAITGNFYAENAQLYVSPDVADPSVVYAVGGGDVLLDNASESTTIIVQGDDRYNAAVLTVAADATNAGVIQLTSTSSYWGSVLATPDMLDNTPTGQILVTAGAGGERWLNGDLDNEGFVSVDAGVELQENGATSAGPTFIQDGGVIQANGQFVVNGGLFDFESGDVSGSFYVNSAQIYVSPDAVDPATIYVVGSGNTLLGNEGPQVTLRVEGDDAFNAGVLTAAAGAVNAGSIVLASTSDYWGSILDAPNTLLNAQGGLIAVADDDSGEGVRWLQGDFINAGTIFTPTDRQLTLQGDASDATPTLIQDGGLIAADGQFVQDGGLFDFESGGVVGSFLVNGASIYVGPEVVDPSTIEIVGPNNTLLENASAATTLWVQGNDGYNAGVLTGAPSAFNAGTIALASVSDYWGETLAAPDGLDNLVGGHIAVFGGGGPAVLSGDLTNDGYLSLSGVSNLYIDTLVNNGTVGVDATAQSLAPGLTALGDASASLEAITGESTLAGQEPTGADGGSFDVTQVTVGAWNNNGTVAVDPGTQLEIAPDDSGRATFTQAGGLIAADGNLIVDGGLFHYTGGALWGSFTVRNGQIQVDASVTQPAVIDVVGQGNTLLDNASDATLRVQGGSPLGDGDAVLTAADGSTNAGTIILESLDGVHHGYFRVPTGTFTNEPSGLIQVNLPPGDAGQGVVTAGWLEGADASGDAAGTVSDTTSQQVLAIYQQLLATLEEYQAEGIPVDPDLIAFAMRMVQTAGVNDGVIAVNSVGAPSDNTDGLVGSLNNLGNIVIQSVEAPFGAADAILNDATGGLWDQYVAPGVEAAWQEGVTMAYSLVVNGQAGLSAQTGSSWFVQQVVAPFVAAAVNRIAGIPQGVLQVGYLIHDASLMTAAAVYNITSAPGTPAWQPVLVSAYAAGLAQAQANGTGQAYAINAVLNAGTFGLYGDVQSFGPALQQSLATGDWTALSAWAGGTLVDAASNPLAEGVLDELGTTAAEASQSGALTGFLSDGSGAADLEALGLTPQGGVESAAETLASDGAPIVGDGVPAAPTLTTVAESWSGEATAETQLGEANVGTQAAATANAEAGLTESLNSAEATTEATARTGDTADAGTLAEAQVEQAQANALAQQAPGVDAATAAEQATTDLQQAEQTCLNDQNSGGGCFAAGVPLLTPDGGKPIETFQENDRLFSRNESDPNGPPVVSTVEKVFVRMASILELGLEGQVIPTTAEHLFWVEGKKEWTIAGDIRPGDRLLSHDGRWVTVESAENTGRVETVYNLRVSGSHTYFVGGLSWGFAVWAHNSYAVNELKVNEAHVFHGEINVNGKAVGYHYRAGGVDSTGAQVIAITDPPNAEGVYRGKVEIFDASTGAWVAKGPSSTFFPDAWTPSEVSLSIQEAYSNTVLTKGNYWEGIASNGVRIGGYLDANGNISTAFPIY